MTTATPEERLLRSLAALRELIGSPAARSPSAAGELLRLDHLVRKYPAAARMSLRLRQRVAAGSSAPPGWSPMPDVDGIPAWRWDDGVVCVATGDLDQLRYIGVALRRFDRMTADELHAFLRG